MKYLPLVITIILLGVLSFLYSQYYELRLLCKQCHMENKTLALEKIDLYIYTDFRENELKLNGKSISPASLINNSKHGTLPLKEYFDNDGFILYFTDFQCDLCVDSLIKTLDEMNFFRDHNISLWIKTSNTRYLSWVEKNYNVNRGLLFRTTPEIEEQLLDIELPYFFVLDIESMRINSTFIPLKENSNLTREYLNNIKEKYE